MLNPDVLKENDPDAKTGQELVPTVELDQALALYRAMIELQPKLSGGAGLGEEELRTFAPFLEVDIVPWPQLPDLNQHIQWLAADDYYDREEEHFALIKDLAIWIVERYYRPASPDQIRQLMLELQKAGTGFVLYSCFERHHIWLGSEEHRWFQLLFERWINCVWDGVIPLPLPDAVHTVGELIAWFDDTGSVRIPRPITHIIEELKKSEE